jgi:hypothetical protein
MRSVWRRRCEHATAFARLTLWPLQSLLSTEASTFRRTQQGARRNTWRLAAPPRRWLTEV